MPVTTETLKSLDIFAELDAQELEDVLSIAGIQKIKEAEVLTYRGTPAQMFYIVLRGDFMVSYDQGRAITLHERGEVVGWSAVVTPFRNTGTVVALTEGEVLTLTGEAFLNLIESNSVFGKKIMRKVNAIAEKRLHFIENPGPEA